MAFAQATTSSSGLRLVAGLDLHNTNSRIEYGSEQDPWVHINDAKNQATHKFGFISASGFENFSLLISHLKREVDPNMSETVEVCSSGRARQIILRGVSYMVYLGKVYQKKQTKGEKS